MVNGWCRLTESGINAFAACREGLIGRYGKLRRGVFITLWELKMIGGKREGAWRKPCRAVRKENLVIRVTPELREFMDAQQQSCADVVEDSIRRTKLFREWTKAVERSRTKAVREVAVSRARP